MTADPPKPMPDQGRRQGGITERPVLTITPGLRPGRCDRPRYRALVLLAVFGSLRWGELAALRRSDIDLTNRTIRVDRQLTEVTGQGLTFGPPKSAAGRRTAFPCSA